MRFALLILGLISLVWSIPRQFLVDENDIVDERPVIDKSDELIFDNLFGFLDPEADLLSTMRTFYLYTNKNTMRHFGVAESEITKLMEFASWLLEAASYHPHTREAQEFADYAAKTLKGLDYDDRVAFFAADLAITEFNKRFLKIARMIFKNDEGVVGYITQLETLPWNLFMREPRRLSEPLAELRNSNLHFSRILIQNYMNRFPYYMQKIRLDEIFGRAEHSYELFKDLWHIDYIDQDF